MGLRSGGVRGGGGGSQGRCEQGIEVFVKIQKKNWGGGAGSGGLVWGRGWGLGGQGRCNREVKFL